MMNIKSNKIKVLFTFLLAIAAILVMLYFLFGGLHKKLKPNLDPKYNSSTLIFAHRGISKYFPENSFEAIDNARSKNFKALEIDLNETKDSVIVLFHDDDCERMIGLKGGIQNYNYSQILNHPYIFNGKTTNNKVLTLEETFKTFGNDFVIYLDIKNRTYDFMEKVISLIKKFSLESSTIIASAHFVLIARIEFDYPEINTCLEGFNSGKESVYYFIPSDFKPDFYASFIHNVNQDHINWLKDKNLLYNKIVYGVDSSNYQKAKLLGLKKILIDYDSTINMQQILE